jgi:hypothetical protein
MQLSEPAPGNANLVEFTLTPEADGTRLLVVESGFDRLADEHDPDQSALAWDNALVALTALAPTL